MASLEDFRSQIDDIDRQIVALLDRRAGVAKEIGAAKSQEGRTKFYDASRQKKVVENAIAAGSGAFPAEALRNVFVEIMSASLALERAPTVGFLGPEGTYSHEAALGEFGNSVTLQPFDSVYDIFFAVDRDWADYGVIPIENSTGGVIHTHLDMFITFTELLICSEIDLGIHLNLISRNPLDRIKTIYSKAEPFQQCQVWLKENLPQVQLIEVGATVKGVEMAKDRDYAAAIGSEIAARKYNVPIVASHIEDMKDNTTRFVVIGKQKSPPTGNDKTSLMISIKDRPGALYELLQPMHDQGINLTKIESRPTRIKAWDLVFFIDMLGHAEDKAISQSLELLRERAASLRVMGSYPRDARMIKRSAAE
ncbi:MAG: prephenate dehydratase [Candidatus Sumerlaeaceae bacterium]